MKKTRILSSLLALSTLPILLAVEPAKQAAEKKEAPQQATVQAPATQMPKTVEVKEEDIEKALAFIPEVVATYGKDGKITGAEIKQILKPQLKAAMKAGETIPPEELKNFTYQISEFTLINELLSKDAEAHGIQANPKKAQEILDTIKKQATPERIKEELAQMNMTEEQLLKQIAKSAQVEEYAKSLAKVEEKEIKEAYKMMEKRFVTLSASHILAKFPDVENGKELTKEQKEATLKKLGEAQKALKDGKSFEETAKQFSDCPSKERGGELGEFHLGEMVPEFEKALLELKEGEISKPVETQFGYHLIKAGKKTTTPYEEAKATLQSHLQTQKQRQVMMQKAEELKKTMNAKLMLEPVTPKNEPAAAPVQK